MDAPALAVADLQTQWKSQDGAAIANSLRQMLDLSQQEMEAGLRAVAAHFGIAGKPASQLPGSSSSSGHQSSAGSAEVVATAVRKRPRQDAQPLLENDIWLQGHGEPEFNNGNRTLLVFNDEDGLKCPINSAAFARLLREPRYAKVQVLRMDGSSGNRLKPNAEACQALADLTELKRVAIANIKRSGDRSMELLAKGLKRVEEAWLHFDDKFFLDMSRHMTHLVRLRIDLTDYGHLDRLTAESVGNCAAFSCLRHLFLRGGGAVHNRAWSKFNGSGSLTDSTFRLLLSKLPALEALDISFNLHLGETSLVLLSAHPKLRTLRWHHLPQSVLSSNLWPGTFSRALSQAPALQRLDVSFLSTNVRPRDGSGEIQDVQRLSDALPHISVVAEPKESGDCLAVWVPAGWPIEECTW